MKFLLLTATVLLLETPGVTCGEYEDFKRDIIAAHNSARRKHGVRALRWDNEIAKFAQAWTDDLARRHVFVHNPGIKQARYGENLFMSTGYPVSAMGKGVVKAWYSEIKNYDFSKPGFSYNTAHFTQVLEYFKLMKNFHIEFPKFPRT